MDNVIHKMRHISDRADISHAQSVACRTNYSDDFKLHCLLNSLIENLLVILITGVKLSYQSVFENVMVAIEQHLEFQVIDFFKGIIRFRHFEIYGSSAELGTHKLLHIFFDF